MIRPSPLVPPNVDLTDFPFMPLLIARLKQSRAWLMCKRRPELAFYMLNLWTASWHGRPAASLENDDDVLADIAMCSPETWDRIKADVLRGWVECDDGKLYHPVVAEQALSSWARKIAQRQRTEAARQAKASRRGAPPLPDGSALHEPATPTAAASVTETVATFVTVSVTDGVTVDVAGSKGQGESRDRENLPIVPLSGDSSPKLSKQRRLKPAGKLCPEDFKPKGSHFDKAAEWGRDAAWVNDIAERMRMWSQANANRDTAWKANWDHALHDWLRKHRDDGRPILMHAGAANGRPTSGPGSARDGIAAGLAALRGETH